MNKWADYLRMIGSEYNSMPNSYLRAPTIGRCVHPHSRGWFSGYFKELNETTYFSDVMCDINEGNTGSPVKHVEFKGLSCPSVQNLYAQYMMRNRLGISIANNDVSHIVDIGGGYGNMCQMARQVGYTGRYTIVDFPLMNEIQESYLSGNGIVDVEFVGEDISKVAPDDNSLLIATYSVSEMPLETRRSIEPHYKLFDYLYFAHNSAFGDVDNVEYFSYLSDALGDDFDVIEWVVDRHRLVVGTDHRIMMCGKGGE